MPNGIVRLPYASPRCRLSPRDQRGIDVHSRDGDGWHLRTVERGEVALPALDAAITVDKVYEDGGV